MPIKKRTSGNPNLRGGGGSGGKISVSNTSGGEETLLGVGITELVWATQDTLTFGATIDPSNPNRVIIGNPPEFLDPIVWSSAQTVDVRVSESDPAEPDTYLTNGFEATVLKGSTGNFTFSSTQGRGFGPESKLSVKTYHAGTLVDDILFTCAANGSQTLGNVTAVVAGYAEDGDGSAYQGRITVTVNGDGVIGSTNSGQCRVEISFLEQKWGERRNINQDIFRDKNPNTPSIDTQPFIKEHDTPSERVIKYLSGIGYFDLGSKWTMNISDIMNLNEDSSKPTDNILLDSSNFGVTDYTTSPWTDGASFTGVTDLDTVQNIMYEEDRVIDIPNYRHCGVADVGCVVQDSWNAAANVDSNQLRVLIDTVSNPSDSLNEYFDGESWRLSRADLTQPHDSEAYCADGDAVFFGGRAYHGSDLPRITENVTGALGTLGSMSAFLPNEKSDSTSRQNPNYTGHTRDAVFWRNFIAPSNTVSYATITMNILTNGDLATKLTNGDIKIYVWKHDSVDPTSVNLNRPASHSVVSPDTSLANSLWGHQSYDFAVFDDGASQTAGGSGMIVNQTGNLLTLTFSGYNVIGGVLCRFDIKKGTYLEEVSVNFV